jgi:hypothetical protein
VPRLESNKQAKEKEEKIKINQINQSVIKSRNL